MARRRNDDEEVRKVLTLWESTAEAGDPLVCIGTTFTFDPEFFEKDCLGRFLNMDSDPDEPGEDLAYLIEQEEKLHQTRISVLVDRRHAGAKPSLRWDVLPIVKHGAAQHAKIAILCWQHLVRVIIGSGNLTKPGYRSNLEVFGKIEAVPNEPSDLVSIRESLDYIGDLLGNAVAADRTKGPKRRCSDNLALVRDRIHDWPLAEMKKRRVVPIFGGVGKSVMERLKECWPGTSDLPTYAHIVSPFFDKDEKCEELISSLGGILAKRKKEGVRFYVTCEQGEAGRVRVHAPQALVDAAAELGECNVNSVTLDPDRALHAKMLALQSDNWELTMIGSSNFTRAGFGIGKSGNFEANLAYCYKAESDEFNQMQGAWPDSEAIELVDAEFDPVSPEDGENENVPLLPTAFKEALFDAGESKLILILGDELPMTWRIAADDKQVLLDSDTCSGHIGDHLVNWGHNSPPSTLNVTWTDKLGSGQADWPVNVLDPAKLPPPADLTNLSLEELIQILASARPYRDIPAIIRKKNNARGTTGIIDPHRRVNTDTFLLRRTRRFALALQQLQERLERRVLNSEALNWRLFGPFGVLALAQALKRESQRPDVTRFFLAELALTLKRVDVNRAAQDGLKPEFIRTQIRACIEKVEQIASEVEVGASSAIEGYTAEAFTEAKK